MSAAVLQLVDAQAALLAALDTHDLAAIEAATEGVRTAAAQVSAEPIAKDADLVPTLRNAIQAADAVRARLNLLADRNRSRLDRLVSLAGAPRAQRYGRSGRFS